MLKGLLTTTAAALALAAGSLLITPGQARADVHVSGNWGSVHVGQRHHRRAERHHHRRHHSWRGHRYGPHCRVLYHTERVRYWNRRHHHWDFRLVRRPHEVCY